MKDDDFGIVAKFFERLGWRVLEQPAKEDNYFDMTLVSAKKSLRVEIKRLRILQNGQWESPPITDPQKNADVCALILPNDDVFCEEMRDFLSHCSDKGYRMFNWLKP